MKTDRKTAKYNEDAARAMANVNIDPDELLKRKVYESQKKSRRPKGEKEFAEIPMCSFFNGTAGIGFKIEFISTGNVFQSPWFEKRELAAAYMKTADFYSALSFLKKMSAGAKIDFSGVKI